MPSCVSSMIRSTSSMLKRSCSFFSAALPSLRPSTTCAEHNQQCETLATRRLRTYIGTPQTDRATDTAVSAFSYVTKTEYWNARDTAIRISNTYLPETFQNVVNCWRNLNSPWFITSWIEKVADPWCWAPPSQCRGVQNQTSPPPLSSRLLDIMKKGKFVSSWRIKECQTTQASCLTWKGGLQNLIYGQGHDVIEVGHVAQLTFISTWANSRSWVICSMLSSMPSVFVSSCSWNRFFFSSSFARL